MIDPVIESLHKYRENRARRLHCNKEEIWAEIKKGEQKSRRAGFRFMAEPKKRALGGNK